MEASLRIGSIVLRVLSIFSGAVLADSLIGGGDAGNTAG